jgi:hypothetical protein
VPRANGLMSMHDVAELAVPARLLLVPAATSTGLRMVLL